MNRWRYYLAGGLAAISCAGLYGMAFGTVVLNGTTSLPHNGYFMVRWPTLPVKGAYVAFTAPEAVREDLRHFSFVKRIVGVPGDEVSSTENEVCVRGVCRKLLPKLLNQGFKPLSPRILQDGEIVVFGDSDDSLDSRYAVIGTIENDRIEAIGFPVAIPHWKELQAWLSEN